MISLPSVALAPGVAQTVQIPTAQLGGPAGSVKIANESPWPLDVTIAGTEQTLPAWMADVFPASGVQTFTLTPQPLATATSAYATAAAMIDVAAQGETIPGTYPVALVRAQQTLPSMCKVAAPISSGDMTFKVDNPGALTPGGFVWMQPAASGQGTGQGIAYPIGYVGSDGTVNLAGLAFERAFAVGDLVVNVPFYVIASNVQAVTIAQGPPQDWQAPRSVYSKFQSWGGGTTTILTPSSGYHFYLYGYKMSMTGTGPEIFISGSISGQLTETLSAAGAIDGSLYTYMTQTGETIQVANSGSAGNAQVALFYTMSNR